MIHRVVELQEPGLHAHLERGFLVVEQAHEERGRVPLDDIAVLLIPETLRKTSWSKKQPGNPVNVEADILGKHVARLLGTHAAPTEAGSPFEHHRTHS